MDIVKIKISPEVLKKDISTETYSGYTFGYYSGLTQILSGGTEGSSLLTDLAIPVFLKQTHEDIGYYSPFDGDISQLDSRVNFIFTADTFAPQIICISNTSDTSLTYLDETVYNVNWGDGSSIETANVFLPESLCHFYNYEGESQTFTISFTGSNNIGVFVVEKKITIPYNVSSYDNPFGTVNFVSNNGSWVDTPNSQKYIYPFDADNTISGQVSSNFVSVPFVITGYSESKLNDLKCFGVNPFIVGKKITLDDGSIGEVTFITESYTAYTMNGLEYLDFTGNTTIFVVASSGLTDQMISQSAITKFEYLMNVIEEPEIQTNVFIERGKNSGLESFRRIGEVSNIISLENYGYGFFDLRNYNDI
jgi:hypothetical protein